jgi:hypothetical protein
MRMPRLSLWWLPVWLERLLGLWRLRRLLPILGTLPLVLDAPEGSANRGKVRFR